MLRAPERILVVRLGAIGDVTNALAVATALKDARPGTHVGWAVHDLSAPLVEEHPAVDRVHVWRRGDGLRGFRAFVRELRAERYGLVLDLQRIQKSGLVARASGAPWVLGFDPPRSKELGWLWSTEWLPPGDPGAHMLTQYMEFVRVLGCGEVEPRLVLPSDAEAEHWAAERAHEWGGAPLLICVGASKPPNRWPAERFVELAQACRERFQGPIVLCGSPQDRVVFARALVAADGERIHDLVGRTSLRQLVALQRRARLFVGCDTGPMHLAVAAGTPVVALFGPADPRRTGPWGGGHRVLRPESRRMEDLAAGEVLEAIAASLEPAPPRDAPRPT